MIGLDEIRRSCHPFLSASDPFSDPFILSDEIDLSVRPVLLEFVIPNLAYKNASSSDSHADPVDVLVKHICKTPPCSIPHLFEVFSGLDVSADWIARQWPDPMPEKDYHRAVLYQGSNYEIVLAVWPVGGETLPHNHGTRGTIGMVRVLSGTIYNQMYELNQDGHLSRMERTTHKAGSLIPVPRNIIHGMGCEGDDQPAMTLHLYIPQIVEVSFWDPITLAPRV